MPVQARFKLTRHVMFANRGKGTANVESERLQLRFDDGKTLEFPFASLALARMNPLNGLWELKPRDGEKTIIQTTGLLFSIGPRPEGRALNQAIRAGFERAQMQTRSVAKR